MQYGITNITYIKIIEIVKKYNKYVFKIFGSRARGSYKNSSDIDLVVDGDVTKIDKFNIMNDFDKLDVPYQIDIIFKQDIAKIELLQSIERDGVILNE